MKIFIKSNILVTFDPRLGEVAEWLKAAPC